MSPTFLVTAHGSAFGIAIAKYIKADASGLTPNLGRKNGRRITYLHQPQDADEYRSGTTDWLKTGSVWREPNKSDTRWQVSVRRNWRARIQQELDEAHWLIYMYTDQDEDCGFCLFECGYFRCTRETDDRKRLITFCRSSDQINGLGGGCVALKVPSARLYAEACYSHDYNPDR